MPSSRRGLQRFFALVSVEQRIFVLHRRNGMHLVRAADGLRIGFRQPERAYLALLDQPLHRADGVLDRRVRVDAVLVVEVDDVDAEALQARLAGLHHVLRPPVHALLAVGLLHLAELGGDDRLAAPSVLERLAEQGLVMSPAVHVGGVEERHALVDGMADHGDRLVVVRVAVDARHRHQPQADGGYFYSGLRPSSRSCMNVSSEQIEVSRCSQSLTSRLKRAISASLILQ